MFHEQGADEKTVKLYKSPAEESANIPPEITKPSGFMGLQEQIGNRAAQRLLAQRSGDGSFELNEATQARINQERGGGQALDSSVQAKMSATTGHDFGGVNVHTSPQADALNRDLGAKAFTTGQDIFFSEGAYDPHSTSGQELIAHELTHVVQQNSGVAGSGSGMTVNAPGDAYEQEADTVAKTVVSGNNASAGGGRAEVQRQLDDEELKNKKPDDEEPMAA